MGPFSIWGSLEVRALHQQTIQTLASFPTWGFIWAWSCSSGDHSSSLPPGESGKGLHLGTIRTGVPLHPEPSRLGSLSTREPHHHSNSGLGCPSTLRTIKAGVPLHPGTIRTGVPLSPGHHQDRGPPPPESHQNWDPPRPGPTQAGNRLCLGPEGGSSGLPRTTRVRRARPTPRLPLGPTGRRNPGRAKGPKWPPARRREDLRLEAPPAAAARRSRPASPGGLTGPRCVLTVVAMVLQPPLGLADPSATRQASSSAATGAYVSDGCSREAATASVS
jgi:hypothetical protein